MIKWWKITNSKENKDYNNLEHKYKILLCLFHKDYLKNHQILFIVILVNNLINLLQDPCHGIVKLISWKELINKKNKEEKEYYNK
jgi:hypothetical protein